MFSGIVEETGFIEKIVRKQNLYVLHVRAKKILKGTKQGDSISVDGVCLTVTGIKKGVLVFDVMLETIVKTSLGKLGVKNMVNLERALRMDGRISGHFVTGHVDNMGAIREIVTGPNYTELQINLKKDLMRYVVPKGSVCVDGVSLTVGDVRRLFFSVYLIPFTLEVTNLGIKKKGDRVNIETDILAKYVFSKEEYSDSLYSLPKDRIQR